MIVFNGPNGYRKTFVYDQSRSVGKTRGFTPSGYWNFVKEDNCEIVYNWVPEQQQVSWRVDVAVAPPRPQPRQGGPVIINNNNTNVNNNNYYSQRPQREYRPSQPQQQNYATGPGGRNSNNATGTGGRGSGNNNANGSGGRP
jgi:hypothetical protein